MKLKTTNKQIRNNFNTIISIGYCDLQVLLSYKKPFAYNAGTYGWNCDFYEVDNVCLSTGYRPIGKSVNYEIIRRYEKQAEVIRSTINYKEEEVLLNSLLHEMITEIKKELNR